MATNEPRNFDLNIEKILEGWEVRHAIREVRVRSYQLSRHCSLCSSDYPGHLKRWKGKERRNTRNTLRKLSQRCFLGA